MLLFFTLFWSKNIIFLGGIHHYDELRRISHVEDDIEDGVRVYEVKLVVGHVEYTYEIDMTTGQILDSEVDL